MLDISWSSEAVGLEAAMAARISAKFLCRLLISSFTQVDNNVIYILM